MKEKETLAKLDQLIKEAPQSEVVDFIAKLAKEVPKLQKLIEDEMKRRGLQSKK